MFFQRRLVVSAVAAASAVATWAVTRQTTPWLTAHAATTPTTPTPPPTTTTKTKKASNAKRGVVFDGAPGLLTIEALELAVDSTSFLRAHRVGEPSEDAVVRILIQRRADDGVVRVLAENCGLLLRRVVGARILAGSWANCDVVATAAPSGAPSAIVPPAGLVELFQVRPHAGVERFTMPEVDVWQLAADYRVCGDDGQVCLAINALTPDRSLVRIENKLLDDVTWTWSFDCINSEFRDDHFDRPVLPPYTIVVPGRHLNQPPEAAFDLGPTVLGTFVVTDPTKPFRQNWHYNYIGANMFASPERQMRYSLPFRVEPGATAVAVTQAAGGTFSHQGKSAYDFSMPEGTDVLAMRAGVVSSVTMDNFLSKFAKGVCPEPVTIDCKTPGSEANSVLVLHDDGTYAQYAHLQQNSAAVKVGDYVGAGALLAKSGNTGFSTNPHLHVDVFVRGRNQNDSSVPIAFRDPTLPAPARDATEVPLGWSRFLNKYNGQLLFVSDGEDYEEEATRTRPLAEAWVADQAQATRVVRLQEPVLTNVLFEPAKGTVVLERGMKWNTAAAAEQEEENKNK